MTLTEKASEIIMQPSHTDDDILELQRIKRQMTNLYSKTNSLWAEAEEQYNKERARKYVVLMEEKMTQWDREKSAKHFAEEEYWDYRTIKAKADGMKETIRAIETFCIAYYTKTKAERSAAMTIQ